MSMYASFQNHNDNDDYATMQLLSLLSFIFGQLTHENNLPTPKVLHWEQGL